MILSSMEVGGVLLPPKGQINTKHVKSLVTGVSHTYESEKVQIVAMEQAFTCWQEFTFHGRILGKIMCGGWGSWDWGPGNTTVAAKISLFDQPAGLERWPVAECLASSTTVPNACGISPGGWCSAGG